MYDSLSISNTDKYKMFNNVGLIDYLSNLCGINVNEPDTARMLAVYTAWTKNVTPNDGGTTTLTITFNPTEFAKLKVLLNK